MAFMTWIIERLNAISEFFYELYLDCYYYGFPLDLLTGWFRNLYVAFNDLAWAFSDFSLWVLDVQDQVSHILNYTDIWDYFGWFFEAAEYAWEWVYNASWFIRLEIEDWWDIAQQTVPDWLSDIEAWTTTQLNNLQATLTVLITDLGLWTTTQLNDLQATFNALIGNVESWTTTQINNAKSAILAIIGDLQTWTITEINNIQALLTTLIDWPALTNWINTWWNDRLLDIESLIDSSFIVRQGLWDGWQDWRDKVTDFFTDPEDWLYKAVDRIIERFW